MRTQNNNHLESFQVILYNIAVPPYGDGEIKLQYKNSTIHRQGISVVIPQFTGGMRLLGLKII